MEQVKRPTSERLTDESPGASQQPARTVRLERLLLVVRAVVTAVSIAVIVQMALPWWGILAPNPASPRDFFQDYASARNILTGRPVYAHHQETMRAYLGLEVAANDINIAYNAHPPTSVLLVLPFAWMDFASAGWWWNVVSLVMLAVTLLMIGRELGWRPALWSVTLSTALLLTWVPLWLHTGYGQFSIVLFALFAAAWVTGRRGRWAWCGALIGVTAAIKLFPVLLLGYLALQRRWRGVLAGIVSISAVTIGTALVTGLEAFVTYATVVLPSLDRWRDDWINASFTGFFARLFAPASSTDALLYSPLLAAGLTAASSLATVAILLLLARRAAWDFDAIFGLATTAILLLSTLTWSHYYVILLLPLCVWLPRLVAAGWAARWRWIVLFITWVLMDIPQLNLALSSVPGGLDGVATPGQALTIMSLHFYGLLGFFVAQAWWLWRDAQAGPAEAGVGRRTRGLKPRLVGRV